ncbi:sialate O-acetylesterase [Rheinheimera sp. F8]|uniref:sialate O-acetylesterase n=1 Tax=Rheinheimera sp. F8 TaxID=1763998 RepID=UPI000744C7F4|nr:sialate O-acetylesterase [Rheinheimera sp. F8]ALZ75367.1 hypothetical protein ATY27_06110 [Rheinheimera sp. F8]ALZ75818.1 hypothetical protein ATY27_08590 [Rheinheimera sp. F8]
MARMSMIRLTARWSSGAVLQHNEPQQLSGTAAPKQLLRVTLQSQHKLYQVETHTDAQGVFSVDIPPQPPSGPWTCTITLADVVLISLHDLWFGQLLLFAGQSNVGWPLARYPDQLSAALQLPAADALCNVRCYVTDAADLHGTGQWLQQNSASYPHWPALLYHFSHEYVASTLSSQSPMMLGLVDLSWPGSAIDAWTEASVPASSPWQPGALFAAKLAPWLQQPFAALLWYQGEQDAMGKEAAHYADKLQQWLHSCRRYAGWDFPLLLVQIAGFGKPGLPDLQHGFVQVRLAQQQLAAVTPNCALVSAADLGDEKDIHPPLKAELARRLVLALAALLSGQRAAGLWLATLQHHSAGTFLQLPVQAGAARWQGRTTPLTGFYCMNAKGQIREVQAELSADGQQILLQLPPETSILLYGLSAQPQLSLYTAQGEPLLPQKWSVPAVY